MTNIKKNDVTPTNVVETVLTASEKLRMARAAAAAKIAAAKAAEAELIALEAELGLTAAVEDVTDKIAGAANMEDLKTVLFTAIRDLFPDTCKSFTAIQAQFPGITFIAPKTPRKPKAPKADGDAAASTVRTATNGRKTKRQITDDLLEGGCTLADLTAAFVAEYPEDLDAEAHAKQYLAGRARKDGERYVAK